MGYEMTESELQVAVAREDLCRYLAACYYEPEPAFAEAGMFGSLADAATLIDPDLAPPARSLGEQFRAESDKLLLDYTRLFVGPMDILAKPYGSFWLDAEKTLMGESTMALLELYGEADFEMDDEFKEVPDHVAVELEFLYLLIFRENEAVRGSDTATAARMRELQQRFLQQHLGAWIDRFASAVSAGAQTGFYRTLADLTMALVKLQVARAIP